MRIAPHEQALENYVKTKIGKLIYRLSRREHKKTKQENCCFHIIFQGLLMSARIFWTSDKYLFS